MLDARGLETVPCNLCGADEFDVLFHSPIDEQDPVHLADYVASTNRYDRYGRVVRCRRCRLVYTNPRLSQETLRQGYAGSVDTDYAEEDSSRSINAHMALRTIRKFARAGRLLDVGCATGYFLNAARLDFEVHGIEPSSWAADHARQRLKLEIQHGNLEDVTLPAGSLDVVSMNDVIEHFSDPRRPSCACTGSSSPGACSTWSRRTSRSSPRACCGESGGGCVRRTSTTSRG